MAARQREFEFTRKDFEILRTLASDHTGIIVSDDKFDMYYGRLSKRIRVLKLKNFSEYCLYLQNHQQDEFTTFINSITTNLTSFFREKHHFEFLESDVMRNMGNGSELRIWSSGCSTGEEPYSIAMTTMGGANGSRVNAKILATDIDSNVLAKAEYGVYDIDRIDGLLDPLKKRWFKRGKGDNSGKVRVANELKSLITFKQLNLMGDWSFRNRFDVIFCRNVVIYFDKPTKVRLFDMFANNLADGGCLIIGHSESMHSLCDRFEVIGKTIHRKIS